MNWFWLIVMLGSAALFVEACVKGVEAEEAKLGATPGNNNVQQCNQSDQDGRADHALGGMVGEGFCVGRWPPRRQVRVLP